MTLVPDNDNTPIISVSTYELVHNETAPPTQVFPDLVVSDNDQTPCDQQSLVAAQVTVETITPDSEDDILMVRE